MTLPHACPTRFFFHVVDGGTVLTDDVGVELPDFAAARREAVKDVRGMLAEGDNEGLCRRHWTVRVTDERGFTLLTLPFSHALRPDCLVAAGASRVTDAGIVLDRQTSADARFGAVSA